jgi:large subunit ribosomal protein L21
MTEITRLVHEHEDLIRARAYQFWEDEGRPNGRHEIHWQRAVESIVTTAAKVAKASAPTKAAAEDVTLIDGIGPKIAGQLAAEGITRLSQIALLSKVALNKIDAKLGLKGRSERDEWISQAQELVAGKAPRAKVDRAKAAR